MARLALAGPVAVAAVLSVPVIGRAPLTTNEVATWSAATRPWRALPRLLAHQDAVFSLYYAAMHVWLSLFGASSAALRAPSNFAALICVALTIRLAARLTSSAVIGVAAGLCLAVNPFFLYYAIDARPYTTVAALAVGTTSLVLEPPRRFSTPAYAALSLLGVWLQMMFLLVVVAQVLALAVRQRDVLRRLFPALGAVALGAAPLVAIAWTQRAQVDWLPRATASTATGWWVHLVQIPPAAASVVAVVAVIGCLVMTRKEPTRALVLASVAALPALSLVVVSAWLPIYDPRYVIESAPMVSVLVAVAFGAGLQRLAPGARPTWTTPTWTTLPAALVAAATAVVMLTSVGVAWQHQHHRFFYEDAAGAARIIQASAQTGTAMLAAPGEARGALYYYLDHNQDGDLPVTDISAVPGRGPISAGNFSGTQASPSAVSTLARSYRRLLVITLGTASLADLVTHLRLGDLCRRSTEHSFGALMVTVCTR